MIRWSVRRAVATRPRKKTRAVGVPTFSSAAQIRTQWMMSTRQGLNSGDKSSAGHKKRRSQPVIPASQASKVYVSAYHTSLLLLCNFSCGIVCAGATGGFLFPLPCGSHTGVRKTQAVHPKGRSVVPRSLTEYTSAAGYAIRSHPRLCFFETTFNIHTPKH